MALASVFEKLRLIDRFSSKFDAIEKAEAPDTYLSDVIGCVEVQWGGGTIEKVITTPNLVRMLTVRDLSPRLGREC